MINLTNITINGTPVVLETKEIAHCFVSSPKVIVTFLTLVIMQGIRAWMHYKAIRKYEKGLMNKETFINNQYLMGIIDIVCFPLVWFLLFVFMRLF